MKTKFKVTTPFGFGVATSEEDLKEMKAMIRKTHGEGVEIQVERISAKVKMIGGSVGSDDKPTLPSGIADILEAIAVVPLGALFSDMTGAERSEAQQEEEDTPCDCENCQHNARVSKEKLSELTKLLASIDNLHTLRFMENDLVIEMNAVIIAQGEDHPQVIHFKKMIKLVKERIDEVGLLKATEPEGEASDEEILERLSYDIANVNNLGDLTLLHSFRQFMSPLLESENPNQKREAELLIGKIDERITELTGESDADKVEGKTPWGKRNPDLLDLDYVSTTVDIGADMLASIDLGYSVTNPQMISLIRRSTDILDEYLKSEVERMETEELSREARLDDAPAEDSPAEELQGRHALSFEAINDMTDYDEVDKLQIELEGKMSQLSDKKQAEIERIHEEMKRLEDLHAAAAGRKAAILDNKADIAHADMVDKVKALQEAITLNSQHLIIHDDIREAMEVLQERYSK